VIVDSDDLCGDEELRMMISAYRVLAYLMVLAVVFQASVIAFAVFGLRNWVVVDGGMLEAHSLRSEPGYAGQIGFLLHQKNGQIVIPLIAILLLICSFFTAVKRGVIWTAALAATVAVQIYLGTFPIGLPVLGILHGIGALAIFGFALIAATRPKVIFTARHAAPTRRKKADAAEFGSGSGKVT
jgi:hypothetical protein